MFNSSNKDLQVSKILFHLQTQLFFELQLGCVAAVKSIGFSLSQPLHDAELEAFITLILQGILPIMLTRRHFTWST